MIKVDVRKATRQDFPFILANETASYVMPWSKEALLDSLGAHQFLVLVEVKSQKIIGHIIYQDIHPESHLLNICVHPRYQKNGFGRWLLSFWIGQSRKANIEECWLEVRRSNRLAQKLYTSMGFETINLRRDYYPDKNNTREDGIIMRKVLK